MSTEIATHAPTIGPALRKAPEPLRNVFRVDHHTTPSAPTGTPQPPGGQT